MFTTGFTLAVLTTVGFYLVYRKVPASVKRLLEKYSLVTDLVACILTYIMFGGTIVALFASAWVGIFVSILLAIMSNPTTAAALDHYMGKLVELKNKLVAWLSANMSKNAPTPVNP